MIKPEQIPKEVADTIILRLESLRVEIPEGVARFMVAEAINAWPGMRDSQHVSFDGRVENAIIIPLPAGNANA